MSKKRGNNEGSIYYRKSDKRWCGSITIGRNDNGKARRRVVYGTTRRDVSEKLTEIQRAASNGLSIDGTRVSVAQHLEQWLTATVAPRVRPSTLYSYRNYVAWYLVPDLGTIKVATLKKEDVQKTVNRLLTAGRSPRTVARARVILVMALDDAVEAGLVARNVAALTSGPRIETFEHVTLTPDQARTLLTVAGETAFGTLIHLALLLGLRRGELQALRWQDIDFTRDELRVARTATLAPGAPRTGEPKTKAGRRTIPFSPAISDLLMRQWHRVVELRRAADVAWQDEDLVFPTAHGTMLSEMTIHHDFKDLLVDAGLPNVRFHDLRHACASLLADQGVAPRTAMEILGHSNIRVTLEVYTRALETSKREAIGALDKLLILED